MFGTIGSLRLLGSLLYTMLFVVGPILTAFRGLQMCLLLLAPIYAVCVIAVIAESVRMVKLGLVASGEWTPVVVQCLLCPGYFANILRRYSLVSGEGVVDLDRALGRAKGRYKPWVGELSGYLDYLRDGGDLTELQIAAINERYGVARLGQQ